MKIPQKNRHWLKEIKKALPKAEKRAEKEAYDITYIYRYAPEIMMKNRGIDNEKISYEIKNGIENIVMEDWNIDENSKNHYKFHFASSYIFSHVIAGFIAEMKGDKIMEYVNDNISLFEDNY